MATPLPEPAMPPPPGETSNFDHPASLVQSSNVAMGIAAPIVTIFFVLRVYTRIWIKRAWIFEDWLVLTSWTGTIAYVGVVAAAMKHHVGRHGWDITHEQARESSYWVHVASILYGVDVCIAKLAVLWLYRRILSPVRWSPFDITVSTLIVILTSFYAAITMAKIWACIPRAKVFDPSIPGTCIDIPALFTVSGLFNTITDVVILLLPIKVVWNMNMNLKKKVTVVLVFTFGLTAPVFSVVGFVVRLTGKNNADKNWVQAEIMLWGLAEMSTGVLCVCFPELGTLWKMSKGRPGPTASIVNGKYRSDDDYPNRRTAGQCPSAGTSRAFRSLNRDPYIELEEGTFSDFRATAQSDHTTTAAERKPQAGVVVTREFRVDSRMG
ncbi:hypothetical protein F4778DRAFT_719706 [Xylariomycetidae sp. FL2044]|nr:hypothetical protein F4778DRAFT_719706 [Xylariomycetidae sp. FL2044]